MSLPLPNDILLLVGEYVEDHRDRYNLLFVCRHFHDLFLRLVYQTAALKDCPQTQSFLGALLRRPELARAVRTLDFHKWRSPSSPVSTSAEGLVPFTQWARSLSLTDEEHAKWGQDLLSGVGEAWIALLLPIASNLRHLQLVYPKQNQYLDRMMQRAVKGEKPFNSLPAFRALRDVSLSHLADEEDSRGTYQPSQVLPFFQLPAMRTFSADSVVESSSPQDESEPNQPVETPAAGTSPISEITLNASNGSQGMQTMIASCTSLKSFRYQHSDSHLLSEGFQPSAFYRSLAGSKESLQTLWLDSYGTHLPFTIAGANETHDEWLGPLTAFTALKDLRIRLPNLLDVRYQAEPSCPLTDVLPSSVESLYVEGCKENSLGMLVGQLRTVLNRRKTQFGALKRLDIEGFFHDEDDEDASGYQPAEATGVRVIKPRVYEAVEPLHQACAEAGIELYVRDRVCNAA
ncbi:hypothetical protein BO70DRAFT_285431 [Aspergillus heteromorphus CBS 117.55]|uniref:Leucine-rich repeat domain-containing protein n=1 Tax=Aspergillus heteromorphus CBS 117.55 TaxID=1448321 RepID=A0A317WRH9_9EURO|nr:uncharacterized protein BO70DRAFT_285431 [Aspergillus heteromorphus CBS 117.55]PWY89056.1 hypothetical protein BO70DRAFT_285431 [Aspergillus heteromorphus CBS 117.55]